MNKLIIHPTETSLWHALVNEAQANTSMVLPENTESYLVFLLMRFTQGTGLTESVLAFDLLEAMNALHHRQARLLRDVGDRSLLLSGLFPGMAEKRGVNVSYFSDVGQAAYQTLAEIEAPSMAALYLQLSAQFASLQSILQAIRCRVFPLSVPRSVSSDAPSFRH